jgi:hypothetical protein
MNLMALQAQDAAVRAKVKAWTQLTAEQRAFWEAMAEHEGRAKSLALGTTLGSALSSFALSPAL